MINCKAHNPNELSISCQLKPAYARMPTRVFFLTARRKQRCFLTLGALLRPETQRTFSFLAMAIMFFQGSWRQKMKALVNIEFRHSAWHQSDPRDDVTTTPVNIGYASYLIEPKISAHLHMFVMAMTDWGIDRIVHNMISISCISPTILSKTILIIIFSPL